MATFMRTCLLDPAQGYYASANADGTEQSRDVLGARGDFITSPEISQVFGELLAVYFISRWQGVAQPERTRLVEFGPGKGTLLADMLRIFGRFQFLHTLKSIHLVETSEGLMRLQLKAIEEALAPLGKHIANPDAPNDKDDPNAIRVEYFPTAESVPITANEWTMAVAHEFFDALPIHIFEKTTNGFKEVLVDLKRNPAASGSSSSAATTEEKRGQSGVTTIKVSDLRARRAEQAAGKTEGGAAASPPSLAAFQYVLSPTETPWTKLLASSNPRFRSLQPGQRVEVSPESWATARRIGELVSGRKAGIPADASKNLGRTEEQAEAIEKERVQGKTAGGCALIIDYGDEKAFGGSFRAFKAHNIVNPLENAGKADLTANVDFSYLKNALATTDARALGPMFQSHFLTSMGVTPRVQALVNNQTDQQRKNVIESSAKRLIDPVGMGGQYKVMGVESGGRVASSGSGEPLSEEDKVYPFDYEQELRKGGESK